MILNKFLISGILCCFCYFSIIAQKKDKVLDNVVIEDTIQTQSSYKFNPLRPSKAAFYEAVVPGLGHIYNKKYWHLPIVYGALGAEVLIFIHNTNQYNRYRDAYKSRLAGFETDEFYFDSQGTKLRDPRVTIDGLERAQKLFRRNRELTLLITVGTYALNIIWANVDAHLIQYNVDKKLTLTPHYELNKIDGINNLGLTLNFKF